MLIPKSTWTVRLLRQQLSLLAFFEVPPQPTAAVPLKVNIHFESISKPKPPGARVCAIPCEYMRT